MEPTIADFTGAGAVTVAGVVAWVARSLLVVVRDHLDAERAIKTAAVKAIQDLGAALRDVAEQAAERAA